jgi:anti-anti-sigma factor
MAAVDKFSETRRSPRQRADQRLSTHPSSIPEQRWRGSRAALADSQTLDVEVRFLPSLSVIRLRGELDLSTWHLLQDAVESLTARPCSGCVVLLDLRDLDFCDSKGLEAIRDAKLMLAGADAQLVLGDPPGALRRLLHITGLEEEFQR